MNNPHTNPGSRVFPGILILLLASMPFQFAAADNSEDGESSRQVLDDSPVRGIEKDHNTRRDRRQFRRSIRSIDGSGNHLIHTEMNAADTMLKREMYADYSDYVSQMSGLDRPNPRAISNAVANQGSDRYNTLGLSDYVWQWGQFLDHDLDLTDGVFPAESNHIHIPAGDAHFDPDSTGNMLMPFNRSAYDPSSGTGLDNPRQQLNQITGWIDASNVYGSDELRAAELRTNDGTGRLKTSEGRLLPFNSAGLPNAGGSGPELFLAGDVRANEQVGLTALHTLFVREHNRLARKIRRNNDELSGDQIYEKARKIVGAQMQVITYKEFLPALLGRGSLSDYQGYNPDVDSRIMNEFSTGAYRLGHSLLNSHLLRLNRRGNEIRAGHLPLRGAFFSPQEIIDHGIEPLLRGLAHQPCQNLDVYVIDDVRNFLFGAPGHGGFDLASLNIQRGRDHGLPSYNDAREHMGLSRVTTFDEISSSPDVQNRLSSVYANVDQVDFWIGGLAEDHMAGSLVGELFHTVLKKQFESLRDGDRFWYQQHLTRSELRQVRSVRLSDIIRRNSRIGSELPDDVFRVASHQ